MTKRRAGRRVVTVDPAPPSPRRPLLVALAIVAAALALTVDERSFGLLTDGRIMTRTAFSIAELGELGIARGNRVDIPRPQGDAVTRYGLGPSIARAAPMLAADALERGIGPGASQTLFVAEQIAFLLLAALAAGLLVESWGGASRDAARAVLACGLASPLVAYAGSDFSEPMQAALVAAAFLWACRAASKDSARDAVLAGVAAGLALLTKSFFVVLLPAVLAIVFFAGERAGRVRRALLVLAGEAPVAAAWLALELVRFGRPFAGYGGEHFSNPPLDGLWRLTVGPNEGLLLYFPLVALAVPGLLLVLRKSRAIGLALSAFCGLVLVSTAAWWSWDGTSGWGPRLLMPIVPLAAAAAALGAARLPRAAFRVLFGAGIAVNALGVLVPDPVTTWVLTILPRRALTPDEAARYPPFAYDKGEDGVPRLFQIHDAARHAALSPIRIDAWILKTRLSGGDVGLALENPPWDSKKPGFEVAVRPETVIPANVRALVGGPLRFTHLGMSLVGRHDPPDGALSFVDALQNQALRGQETGRYDRAVAFAERLYALTPSPVTATILLESYRLAGRRETIDAWLRSVRKADATGPEFGLVLALYERDLGHPEKARSYADRVAAAYATTPVYKTLSSTPIERWPKALRELSSTAHRE